jgi:putative membrane protein
MSYGLFLLIFLILPIAAMVALVVAARRGRRRRGMTMGRHYLGLGILTLIAFVWTTPWDNYLIAQGVWDSPADRVIGRVGYVPLEEYAFFILMPLLNGTLMVFLLNVESLRAKPMLRHQKRARWGVVVLTLSLMVGGWVALMFQVGTYLGLMLLWFTPPLFIQWMYDPVGLWKEKRVVMAGTLIPTAYFGLADRFAIADGIWVISPDRTTGLRMGVVPIEEVLFFAITSLLLAQGLVLWHGIGRRISDR